ncbi:MAG: ABC transporter ATP-binding protein [Pseudomonadota bacterium]|nr:ABC transporter ATP-binding protein [Pseudomonadota bacterium]
MKFAEPVLEALSNPLGLFRNTDDYAKNNYKRLSFEKNIEVKNICYKYPNSVDFALSDVSFNIQKGESIGVVGKSGAGKSTFADIFLGLLKPQSGKIYTDGVDIYNDLYSWQKKVGYVQQDIFLLDESIRKNIAFGCTENEIDDDKLNQVIMESQLEEFVSSLAEGLNTKLGERGVRLSGGQKQRFGIARALYHDSPILVFDEATSALDGETEKEIVYAIENLKGVRTIIVIAHRLSTIKSCNRVVELDEGKLKNIR